MIQTDENSFIVSKKLNLKIAFHWGNKVFEPAKALGIPKVKVAMLVHMTAFFLLIWNFSIKFEAHTSISGIALVNAVKTNREKKSVEMTSDPGNWANRYGEF